MTTTAVQIASTGTKAPLSGMRKGALTCGGAKGTRTPNPLLAKQVRYQLRHGPEPAPRGRRTSYSLGSVSGFRPQGLLGLLVLHLLGDRGGSHRSDHEEQELLHGCPPSLAGTAGIGIGGPNRT